MNNGMTVSLDYIQERFDRDYGFENMYTQQELKEWVYSAIATIGVYASLELCVTDGLDDNPDPVSLVNYRAKLPDDLVVPLMVRHYDTKIPFVCSSSPFKTYSLYDIPFGNSNYTYYLSKNHIFSESIEECDLEMAYLKMPTDDLGNPVVIDNEEFIKAIIAYAAERVSFRGWLKKMVDKQTYDTLKQEWMYRAVSSKHKMHTPTIDEMEALKNQWVGSLIPKMNEHDSSFRYLNGKRGHWNTLNR